MPHATAEKQRSAVDKETEELRQLVIEARKSPDVGPKAEKCFDRLRRIYTDEPGLFSAEDVRWVNVLKGFLSVRLAAHTPTRGKHTPKAKRKGDKLDHCWRCETQIDERFSEICPTCDSKAYHWYVCPVCQACGCQRGTKVLV